MNSNKNKWVAIGDRTGKVYCQSEYRSEVFRLLQEMYPSCKDQAESGSVRGRKYKSNITPVLPEMIRVSRSMNG